jgi:endoglucanase
MPEQSRSCVRVPQSRGRETYDAFFERYLEAFFADADADAAHLASIGLISVRLSINYRIFEDDSRPGEFKEDGFAKLDRVIDIAANHGLYTIIDLQALPGAQNQHWHSDNSTYWANFWTHRDLQDHAVALWEAIASRYVGNPWVGGYNPVNEPADASGQAIGPFYKRLEAAIRAVDPDDIFVLGR